MVIHSGKASGGLSSVVPAKLGPILRRILVLCGAWVPGLAHCARSPGTTEYKRLMSPALQRLVADGGQAHSGRQRFRIDLEMDDRRLARGARGGEGGSEILGALDLHAEAAEGAGVIRKIRIVQLRRHDAIWVFALLVHADRAVEAVIRDPHTQRQFVLHGSGEVLPRP